MPDMIWEKKLSKNFGPKGLTQGTWGLDLRISEVWNFFDYNSWSFGANRAFLDQWHGLETQKHFQLGLKFQPICYDNFCLFLCTA